MRIYCWIVSIIFSLFAVSPAVAAFKGPTQAPPLGNVPGVIWNIPAADSNQKQAATEYNVGGAARVGGDIFMSDSKALRIDSVGQQDTTLNIGNWGPKSFLINVIGDIHTDNTDGAVGRISAYEYCYQDALGNPKNCISAWPNGNGGGPYVQLSGDTMSGILTLSGDPVGTLDAVTKQYVDNMANGGGPWPFVLLSGDTMTGALILSGDPTAPLEAATKQYVDNAVGVVGGPFVQLSGDTMTGDLLLNGDPTQAMQAVTKQYVDNIVSGGNGPFVQLSGDTMIGVLTLSGDPTAPLEAATKQYVDNNSGVIEVDTGFGLKGGPITTFGTIRVNQPDLDPLYVNIPGDTMTGMLQVISDSDQTSIYAKTDAPGGIGVKAEAEQYAGWFTGNNYGVYAQTKSSGVGTAVRGFNGTTGGSFQGTDKGILSEGTGNASEGGNFRGNKSGVVATGKLEGVRAVIPDGETGDAVVGIGYNGAKFTGSRYGAYARGDMAGVYGVDNNQTGFGYLGYGDNGVYGQGLIGVYAVGDTTGLHAQDNDTGIYGKVGAGSYSFRGNGIISTTGDISAPQNDVTDCTTYSINPGAGTFICPYGRLLAGIKKNASNVIDGIYCCEL